MKNLLLVLVLFLSIVTVAQAQPSRSDSATSSGLLSADASVITGFGQLEGAVCQTDGTNNTTVVLYDHASGATGTELYKMTVPYYNYFGGAIFTTPIRFKLGIYMDITNGSCIIYYRK